MAKIIKKITDSVKRSLQRLDKKLESVEQKLGKRLNR